jgi:coenzyme F420 hydrogenase subunit beta
VREAAAAGYITLETEDASLLPRSQPNLLATRGRLWGQLLTLKLGGATAPRFEGFALGRWWLRLPLKTKLQSTVGTLRRIGRKGLRGRIAAPGWEGGAS